VQRKRPTIPDVAERARVSVGTVSNVLNAPDSVGADLRDRVLKAIETLGYSQNLLAHGLRKRRSNMVGLCVPHTSNAYFSALVNAFEEIASARGFEILQVLSRFDATEEYERVSSLLKYKIGGLILVPGLEAEKTLKLVARSGTPVVVVDRVLQNERVDLVSFDNKGAMFEATRRLIALGHRRILFVVRYRSLVVSQDRIEGLVAASREAAQPVVTDVLECGDDEAAFKVQLAADLKKHRYTAIIFSNSKAGAWLVRALRAFGLRLPDDISLLAFDEPEWADIISPALSMIRQPTRDIAHKAWELLISRMNGEATVPRRVVLPAAPVDFRETVGPVNQSAISGAA
jgi:LacI family transcriptional regulator